MQTVTLLSQFVQANLGEMKLPPSPLYLRYIAALTTLKMTEEEEEYVRIGRKELQLILAQIDEMKKKLGELRK
jgi:hypothetical protein